MERGDVDIRATRFQKSKPPLGPDPRNQLLELGTADLASLDRRRQVGQLAAADVDVSPYPKEAVLRKIAGWLSQERARR